MMGQFTIESMSGGSSFELSEFNLKLDDDFNVASLQAQGGQYALYAKKFLLVDIVEPLSPAGMVSASIKKNIQKGLKVVRYNKRIIKIIKFMVNKSLPIRKQT